MFQFSVNGASTDNYFYVNLYDEVIKDGYELIQEPIFAITSQQTGKQKLFYPYTMDSDNYKRYYKFLVKYIKTEAAPVFYPGTGFIALNDKDYPFGFYDLQIWQKEAGYTDLSLDNTIKLLYTGLLNVNGTGDSTEVDYSEYATTDSDTDNVYLTYVKP
tara:strand:- start:453 stop:929 length:477 start_codon:yes stop_codon:yes gene_type:complete